VNIEVKPQSEVAIVTGASRGLGRSTALNLAKKGVDVIVTYHANRAEADTVVAAIEAEGRKGVALQLDASNVASFDGFIGQVRSVLAGTFGRSSSTFSSTTRARHISRLSIRRRKKRSMRWSTFISKGFSS
jgi:NAD(P)-dependent dehydrogenase (short-subunit alcohol dehydrogenase family)